MDNPEKKSNDQVMCPYCASSQISPVRKNYDGGLGCLGLILFGWWGLLLGLVENLHTFRSHRRRDRSRHGLR